MEVSTTCFVVYEEDVKELCLRRWGEVLRNGLVGFTRLTRPSYAD
jgi:hypothetical protein